MKTKHYKKRHLQKTLKKYKKGIKKGGQYSEQYISFDELKNFIFFIDELKSNKKEPKINYLFDEKEKFVLYKKIPSKINDWLLGDFIIHSNYIDKFLYVLFIDKNITELTTNSKLMNGQIPNYVNDENITKFIQFLINNKENEKIQNILFDYPKDELIKDINYDKNNFINFLIVQNPKLKIDEIDDTKENSKTKEYIPQTEKFNGKDDKKNKKIESPKSQKNVTKKQLIKDLIKLPMKELKKVASLFRKTHKKSPSLP
jgi:hypothetical protein